MGIQRDFSDELEALTDSNWVASRLDLLARRQGKRRQELQDLLESPRVSGKDAGERTDRAEALFAQLDAKGRSKFWANLFPKLATHLERAWLDVPSRPFRTNFSQVPFRAPRRDDIASRGRAEFVVAICDALRGLDPDPAWLAAWAPHLGYAWWGKNSIGWLLSAVLRGGGAEADAVRGVLVDSLNGDHEIGSMGDHVIVGLLNSGRQEDWETIGRLLLAAQRQEGLRQSILEVADEANPDAFRHLLGVILEHRLFRFASVVRAFDVWLGLMWSARSQGLVKASLARLAELLDSPALVERALSGDDPDDVYLALWVLAFRDAEQAIPAAEAALNSPSPEMRYAGLHALARLELYPDTLQVVAKRLKGGAEDDPRMHMATVRFLSQLNFTEISDGLWDAVVALYEATPTRKTKLEPLLWPWVVLTHERSAVAQALAAMATEAPERLIPFAPSLDTHALVRLIGELAGTGLDWSRGAPQERDRLELTPEARALMIQLTGDRRRDVQNAAFEALAPLPVQQDEVEQLLSVLHRSAGGLRAGALTRLLKLSDEEAIDAATRLLSDKNAKKRAAGAEVLTGMVDAGRSIETVSEVAASFADQLGTGGVAESLAALLGARPELVTLEDCLGLVPPGSRSDSITPRHRGHVLETDAARATFRSVAALFLEHGDTEIQVSRGEDGEYGTEVQLLSSAGWAFPRPKANVPAAEDARSRLPLLEVWLEWLNDPERARDDDGLEVIRALAWMNRGDSHRVELPDAFDAFGAWSLRTGFERLLSWLARLSEPVGVGKFLVQYVEDVLAKPDAVSAEETAEWASLHDLGTSDTPSSATEMVPATRFGALQMVRSVMPDHFRSEDNARIGQLAMFAMDEGLEACHSGPSVDTFVAAYDAGLLNDRDFIWLLLHKRDVEDKSHLWGGWSRAFGPIAEVTGLRMPEVLAERPDLAEAVAEVRDRVIEVELTRGERPSVATTPASMLRYAGGADAMIGLLSALGGDKIVRQHQFGKPTRAFSLSRLVSITSPTGEDSEERFRGLVSASGLSENRLVEVALFAPQWAELIEATINFPHLEDAVWWLHGHTKGKDHWRGPELRDLWAARISERSELDADDLEDGAVDVEWFRRVIAKVGEDGWERLQAPAKYASTSGGHKRAQLFANAMMGREKASGLMDKIDGKRHQDSVRALGLVPLPKGVKKAAAETLKRYVRMQDFIRESRKFGSQRQASERRAVEIGLQNLARTAGYRDPRRLQWAMEAEAVRDLAAGPVTHTEGVVEVSLSLDDLGEPVLSVTKSGKALKAVPAKLRKVAAIAALRGRVGDLRRQRSRMQASLEQSLRRGETFAREELEGFLEHPMLRHLVERLVFTSEAGACGYPIEKGLALQGLDGSVEPLGASETVRLAHPLDFLSRRDWAEWQRECFRAERVQPFKQLFREVYPKTKAEQGTEAQTRRYAGHQVNPSQAMALLKSRQWLSEPGEAVRKTYHDEGLVAQLWFQEPFLTPADVEDLTVEAVSFRTVGRDAQPVLLRDVPDLIFSETMRDLDLVVSVAHAGGVDPEASASTVEMRATLLQETLSLLDINNVEVKERHAVITGDLGRYSVHLGSANTTVSPGRALLIVAVHSQWRGRLFLPFADDDPKTAEVLTKTLLLARDSDIKDPSILDQIRG